MVLFGVYTFYNRNLSAEKVKAFEVVMTNNLIQKEITETTEQKSAQAVEDKQLQEVQSSQTQDVAETTKIAETKHVATKNTSIPTPTSTPKATPTPSIKATPTSTPIIKATIKATPTPVPVQPQLLIDKIKGKGNAQQAIVVTTNGFGKVSATITTFEKVNGAWKQVFSISGNVGKTGFAYNKVEGDGHSPIGIFSLGTAFGIYSNPGTAMAYKKSTANDFWVDDSNSALYNTWQVGPANGRWTSAENMYIAPYNYGFVINYNIAKRTPGKGSAIFFHVWSGAGHGTAGCTATSQNNVINILKWLNPSKNPVIIQGPMPEVLKM